MGGRVYEGLNANRNKLMWPLQFLIPHAVDFIKIRTPPKLLQLLNPVIYMHNSGVQTDNLMYSLSIRIPTCGCVDM